MSRLQYICGEFQPLVRSAVNAVRQNINNAEVTIVYVRPRGRGPGSPFSFDEVAAMWESVFPNEIHRNRLRIVSSADPVPPGCGEIEWPLPDDPEAEYSEEAARCEMSSIPPFWMESVHYAVARTIQDMDGQWKSALDEALV